HDLVDVARVGRAELAEEIEAAVQLPGRVRIRPRVEQRLQARRDARAAVVRDGTAPGGTDGGRRTGRERAHRAVGEVRLNERSQVVVDVDVRLTERGTALERRRQRTVHVDLFD